ESAEKPSYKFGRRSSPKTIGWLASFASDLSPPIPPAAALPNWPVPRESKRMCTYARQTAMPVSRFAGLLAQPLGGQRQVLQLGVGFFQRNLMVFAGSKPAVGIQTDPLGGQVSQRLLHTLDDQFRRVDLGETDVDATQADLHMFRQFAR